MGYQWEDIRATIERLEEESLVEELTQIEEKEGFIEVSSTITERTEAYLKLLGALALGVNVGLIAILFCYIFLVSLLHIEF
jgi:hypothetical protein